MGVANLACANSTCGKRHCGVLGHFGTSKRCLGCHRIADGAGVAAFRHALANTAAATPDSIPTTLGTVTIGAGAPETSAQGASPRWNLGWPQMDDNPV